MVKRIKIYKIYIDNYISMCYTVSDLANMWR